MSDKLSLKKRVFGSRSAVAMLAAVVLLLLPACSAQQAPEVTTAPTESAVRTFAPPTQTPEPSPSPTPTTEPTASPTPKPTIVVSFPPLATTDKGANVFPQVVADKTEAMTNEPVNFKIVTSENVNSIRTVIDGEEGTKVYKEYTTENGTRIWQTKIFFTKGGSRRVQFKCGMASGGTAYIPKTPVKITVTFEYTAESTSKKISKGKTVTFTLKTPDTIDTITSYVDGVKQEEYDEPDSNKDGVKIWKISITFFKLGTRAVTFEAYDGSKLKKTFPDPGIPIIVEDNSAG